MTDLTETADWFMLTCCGIISLAPIVGAILVITVLLKGV